MMLAGEGGLPPKHLFLVDKPKIDGGFRFYWLTLPAVILDNYCKKSTFLKGDNYVTGSRTGSFFE